MFCVPSIRDKLLNSSDVKQWEKLRNGREWKEIEGFWNQAEQNSNEKLMRKSTIYTQTFTYLPLFFHLFQKAIYGSKFIFLGAFNFLL